jgi:hypothetical protein
MADFTGYYKLSEKSWIVSRELGASVSKNSGFRLNADHRMEVLDLPDFDISGEPNRCSYNGTGDWSWDEDGDVRVTLEIKAFTPAAAANRPSCGPSNVGVFWLLGHSPPHRLWYNIGDPDEEKGLMYVRQSP